MENDPQDIQIFRGKNPAEETEYVCSCINEKVQKEGMRYRDLAVVTGDLASYGKEIAHRFDEAGIPYFLDDKKSILENPFIELIRAALDGVKDASYESIFRYLKTGFVYDETYSREEAQVLTDRMENYARALGIKGWKNWDMTWEKPGRGGERLSLGRTEPVPSVGVRTFKGSCARLLKRKMPPFLLLPRFCAGP